MQYNHILQNINLDTRILTITLNRETKLNALNIELIQELQHLLKEHINNPQVRGVIITGAGVKAFAAGADIAEFATFTQAQGVQLATNGHTTFNLIEQYPKPVIAAVNGFALGGGCELAMACHLRIMSHNAAFGQPEVNLGIIPGYGGTQRLIQLVGKTKALELLMTADIVKADEAHDLGWANYVVPQAELIETTQNILLKIIQKAPLALQKIIECANAYFDETANGLQVEIQKFGECCNTHDFKEGTAAFLEKRKANFEGK